MHRREPAADRRARVPRDDPRERAPPRAPRSPAGSLYRAPEAVPRRCFRVRRSWRRCASTAAPRHRHPRPARPMPPSLSGAGASGRRRSTCRTRRVRRPQPRWHSRPRQAARSDADARRAQREAVARHGMISQPLVSRYSSRGARYSSSVRSSSRMRRNSCSSALRSRRSTVNAVFPCSGLTSSTANPANALASARQSTTTRWDPGVTCGNHAHDVTSPHGPVFARVKGVVGSDRRSAARWRCRRKVRGSSGEDEVRSPGRERRCAAVIRGSAQGGSRPIEGRLGDGIDVRWLVGGADARAGRTPGDGGEARVSVWDAALLRRRAVARHGRDRV
jgi:hypothetical protein